MARISFEHLSGPEQGRSASLPRLPATIGSGPDMDVVIPGLAPRHAVLYQRDGNVVLLDSGSALGTFLAGNEIHEAVLRDGDVVELGGGGPRLRFQLPDAPRARTQSHMLPARLSETMAFRMVHQSSRSFRRTLIAVLAVAAALLSWSYLQSRRLDREVATLLLTNHLWVRVFVPEPWLANLRLGQSANVHVDGFPQRQFQGEIEQISRAAEFTPRNVQTVEERIKQVFAIKVRLQNEEGLLRAGMSADVAFSFNRK